MPDCSTTEINNGLNVPSSRGAPAWRYRASYVPKPASSRIRLVSGDDHVACWTREGRYHVLPVASGAITALPPFVPVFPKFHCSDQYAGSLLRGVACHVERAFPVPFWWMDLGG